MTEELFRADAYLKTCSATVNVDTQLSQRVEMSVPQAE